MSTSTILNLHTYAAQMDYASTRQHANTAGAPLPRIPRRSSSTRSVTLTTLSAPSSPPATIERLPAVPAALVVQPPTPPRAEFAAADASSSSSGSGSDSYVHMHPRAKRPRTPKMHPFRSPADSTPTPAVLFARGVAFPASADETPMSGNETPRASSSQLTPRASLRIDLDELKKPRPLSESSAPPSLTTSIRAEGAGNRAVSAPQEGAANMARKKSGEPLKSSLKARRPVVRGDLSVITGESLASTKSEPSTPMATKSVHFDARLERVKLFLAEQKPLAISREGSPTDTSGTESDFPSAIYGSARGEEDKMLTMQLTNKPAAPRADADLALEDLTLSEDRTALVGRARARNIAFEKWVAVRFTVDSWQTTSEVTAKYLDSLPGGVFDRFAFTIRLGDMLTRIEEKTLFCALRYNVAGREIWDNNAGENYKVTFAKVARPRPLAVSEGGLASLKSKLENVAKGQETVGGFMAHQSKRRAPAPFTLEASTSLSARYDFAASWKSPWTRSPPMSTTPTPTKSSHARNVTYPHVSRRGAVEKQPLSSGTAFKDSPMHTFTRGSPRIMDPWDASPSPSPSPSSSSFGNASGEMEALALEHTPVPVMSRRRTKERGYGYFDLGASPSVKFTPTSSPSPSHTPTPTRAHPWFAVTRGGSEDSTPSATSNEDSSVEGSPTEDEGFESYSSFLNKYCYYTGASDGPTSFLDVPPDAIHRSHSASSVEEFLSTSSAYVLGPAPTRSSSCDDVVTIGSGATTPTAHGAGFGFGSPQMQMQFAAH